LDRYEIFAEELMKVTPNLSDKPVGWAHPGFHYQNAANAAIKRRSLLKDILPVRTPVEHNTRAESTLYEDPGLTA
jgi:hypothetical protein